MEALEVDLASSKQELSLAKKRVSELQHALEDDMNYDSDGLSHENSDLSDDSDTNIETSSAVPSEPRSYRSVEDLENDDELELKLKKKLSEIRDTTDARSESGSSSTRRTSASASLSPKSDKDDSKDETKMRKSDHRSREGRRQKSIEKRKSLERMSQKAKRDTPGAFDI